MEGTKDDDPDDLPFDAAFRGLDTASTTPQTTITRLLPLETRPDFLGGLTPNSTNQLSLSSPYGMLPRLQSLPPPKKAKFANADQENVYLKMFQGDLSVEWECTSHELHMKVSCGDHESCPQGFQGVLVKVRFVRGGRGDTTLSQSTEVHQHGGKLKSNLGFSILNPKLSSNEKQNAALAARIIHLFLRSHGAVLDDIIFFSSTYHLYHVYQGREQWQDMLDIAMVAADVGINKNFSKRAIADTLSGVGMVLESMERFKEAGDVYRQAAQEYAEGADATFLCADAGVAFMQAGEYSEGEKSFVAALYWDSWREEEWDSNGSPTNDILANLLHLYRNWRSGVTIPTILATLLYLVGFRSEGTFAADFVPYLGRQYDEILQPKFSTERLARRALMRAVNANNVKRFRKELLKCKRVDVRLSGELLGAQWESPSAQLTEEAALQRLVKVHAVDLISCAHCRATEERKAGNFQCCPCKSVFYCKERCRVAHWKVEHKQVCPYRKKERKPCNGAAT